MSTWRKALGKRDHEKLVGTRFPELWTPALNSFDLPDVLPGWFYLLRTRRRRGRGAWARTFGQDGTPEGTPRTVAGKLLEQWGLATRHPAGSPGEEALADWLVQELLVVKRSRGIPRRHRKVMGLRPLHAMLLRADLPRSWANTRDVPAWLGLMLSDSLGSDDPRALGERDGRLLAAFGPGMTLDERGGRDSLDLRRVVDLDQRLAASIAQALGELPAKGSADLAAAARLTPRVSGVAWSMLSDFIETYAGAMPSRMFTRQFMALTSAVMTRDFLSHVDTVLEGWATGHPVEQSPRIVVDLSEGRHRALVRVARQSFRRVADRLRQYMIPFAGLRMAWNGIPGRSGKVTETMNELFGLAHVMRTPGAAGSPDMFRLEGWLGGLRGQVDEAASSVLSAEQARAFRERLHRPESLLDALAQAVVTEIGGTGYKRRARDFLRGCAGYNLSMGLLRGPDADRSRGSTPAWRMSDELLEAVVHAWTWRRGEDGRWNPSPLSVGDLVEHLAGDLGLEVRVPDDPGLARENEAFLRDRLASLGLFRSVSDAERMQRITPRFGPKGAREART